MTETTLHTPVFLNEAVESLRVQPDHWYVDATYGRGGHTREIISRGGKVLAFDIDAEAIEFAHEHDQSLMTDQQLIVIRANFDQLKTEVEQLKTKHNLKISGVLFDFGTSSNQLLSETRGFSFDSPAPLDMRMDQRLGVTAEDFLRVLTEKQLTEIFRDLGGEHEAKKVAHVTKAYALAHSPVTAQGLADAIAKAKYEKRGRLHPATKAFQALRMIVNTELDNIRTGLRQALEILEPQSRIVTIAFHEGEDRLAKHFFADWERQGKGQRSPKEAIQPSETETALNPRARSAKMRIFTTC